MQLTQYFISVLAPDRTGLWSSFPGPLQYNDRHQGGELLWQRLQFHHRRIRRSELLHLGKNHEPDNRSVPRRRKHCQLCSATPDHLPVGHQWNRQHGEDLESAAGELCDQASGRVLGEDNKEESVPHVRVSADALEMAHRYIYIANQISGGCLRMNY